jgi:hypothetical protein
MKIKIILVKFVQNIRFILKKEKMYLNVLKVIPKKWYIKTILLVVGFTNRLKELRRIIKMANKENLEKRKITQEGIKIIKNLPAGYDLRGMYEYTTTDFFSEEDRRIIESIKKLGTGGYRI